MAWIKEQERTGALGRVTNRLDPTANILRVFRLNPPVMKAHLDLFQAIMAGPSDLSRAEREMIATAVSARNHCHY